VLKVSLINTNQRTLPTNQATDQTTWKIENKLNNVHYLKSRGTREFLPRKARSLQSPGLRPSVRPSVTFVYCIQTAEDIVKLLSRPGSPIILVFWLREPVPIQGESLQRGGRKIHGDGENLRFSTDIAVYLGNGTDRSIRTYL